MPNGMPLLTILAGLVAFVPSFFALRCFYQLLRPIRVTPRLRVVFEGSGPDQILATVTNVSGEDQVPVRCTAKSTYPAGAILRRYMRHPFTSPKLYPNIWYAGASFNLAASLIWLAPSQRVELHPPCRITRCACSCPR